MIDEKERMQAMAWIAGFLALGVVLALGLLLVAWPVEQMFARGFSPASIADARAYFVSLAERGPGAWFKFLQYVLWNAPTDHDGADFVRRLARVLGPGWTPQQIARLDGPFAEAPGPGAIAALSIAFLVFVIGAGSSPYEMRRKSQGAARWATERDIRKWKLYAKTGLILGGRPYWSPTWSDPFRRLQRPIRNWEPLSVADLAPPGTGKSVQITANLLADWEDTKVIPAPSMLINDPKGELYKDTAHWRSQLGPVFKLNWGETKDTNSDSWNPLSPASIPLGENARRLRVFLEQELLAIYKSPGRVSDALAYLQRAMQDREDWRHDVIADPSFAFLGKPLDVEGGPAALRAAFDSRAKGIFQAVEELSECYTKREQVIDRMVAVLIPDTVEEHWRNTGRSAGAGFILFHMAQCDRLGVEPSFGKLLEWMSGISKASSDADVEAVAAAQGPKGQGSNNDDDEVAQLLIEALEEAATHAYPARVRMELSQLKMKPDKERGSVVSTFDASIAVFKQASVRKRTSTSSFRLIDIRGQGTHDAHSGKQLRKGELPPPVTIYVCVSLDSIEAFGKVTGLLFEQVAASLLSQDPDQIKKSRPVYVFADEFWTLPPLQSLLQVPAFGRGQRVSLDLVGQTWSQIGLKFQRQAQDMIKAMQAATSNWIVKTTNSLEDAKQLSEMMGNVTHIKRSFSRERGFKLNFGQGGQGINIGGGNMSTDLVGLPLMRHDELMSMTKLDPATNVRGRQLIVMSGRRNTPIDCEPFIWFYDPVMKLRAGKQLPFIPRQRWFGQTAETPAPSAPPPAPRSALAAGFAAAAGRKAS